tara:strand:- start:44902 stop:46254 length:1353 start_codon:yes stop_codon:yes gene_type:complete
MPEHDDGFGYFGDAALDVVVLPGFGPDTNSLLSRGAIMGINHYLAERLVLETTAAVRSIALIDKETMLVPGAYSYADDDNWVLKIRNQTKCRTTIWVEVGASLVKEECCVHMVSSVGQETIVRTPLEEAANVAIDWLVAEGIAFRKDAPWWYQAPSVEHLIPYWAGQYLTVELLLSADAETGLRDQYRDDEVESSVAMLLRLAEGLAALVPQVGFMVSQAMTIAGDRDLLDKPIEERIAKLVHASQSGAVLDVLSPWMLTYLEDPKATSRLCRHRASAQSAHAEWLEGIASEVSEKAFGVLTALPPSVGGCDIQLGAGLGALEFGATLAEVTALLGPPREDPDTPMSWMFRDASIWAAFTDEPSALHSLDVGSATGWTVHGTNLWQHSVAELIAWGKRYGLAFTQEVVGDKVELVSSALSVSFLFEHGSLVMIMWSMIEDDTEELVEDDE